ncbi:MAG: hypothetical protein WKG07_32485 [Hymenobacter sp.]
MPAAGDAGTAPLPTDPTPAATAIPWPLTTNEASPRTLPNDSTYRDLELTDYYAFDDGTGEASLPLPAQSTGPATYFAYPITAAQADQVRAIRLAPVFNNIPDRPGRRKLPEPLGDGGRSGPTTTASPPTSRWLPKPGVAAMPG